MVSWLFIGPNPLAGIGQVTLQYLKCVQSLGHEAEYVVLGAQPLATRYDRGFAFLLPLEDHMTLFDSVSKLCDRVQVMTVCETDPVNSKYELFKRFPEVLVPSEFSRQILEKQFPSVKWTLFRHWTFEKPHKSPTSTDPYTFYTIGNVMDPRKNIIQLINCFQEVRARAPNVRLVLKATCLQPVTWQVPGVVIINGLLDSEALERVHASCHCYVNCSHSEGVGMGAVEAAVRGKPVVITDFGGLKEYVDTPWVVPCTQGPIGFDDFLFRKEDEWGFPDGEALKACMLDCYDRRVTHWDHAHTLKLMDEVRERFSAEP